jgi:hypothetical protein
MLAALRALIRTGWTVTTEAHTAYWLYEGLVYLGLLSAIAAIPAIVGWDTAARPYLIGLGIIAWAILFLAALAYVGLRHQRPESTKEPIPFIPPEMHKVVEAPLAKPVYTEEARKERHKAWRAIYQVMDGPLSTALDKGSLVSNTWKESIKADPKAYIARIDEFRHEYAQATLAIVAIYRDFAWHGDIPRFFEDQSTGWGPAQHAMNEAMNIFRTTLKGFPDNPPRQMVELLDSQAQAFRKGVAGCGRWLTEAKKYALKQLDEVARL